MGGGGGGGGGREEGGTREMKEEEGKTERGMEAGTCTCKACEQTVIRMQSQYQTPYPYTIAVNLTLTTYLHSMEHTHIPLHTLKCPQSHSRAAVEAPWG